MRRASTDVLLTDIFITMVLGLKTDLESKSCKRGKCYSQVVVAVHDTPVETIENGCEYNGPFATALKLSSFSLQTTSVIVGDEHHNGVIN